KLKETPAPKLVVGSAENPSTQRMPSGFRRSGGLRLAQGLLPRFQLPVSFVLCDAVALLQSPRKILTVSGNIFQVVIGQLGPLLTGGSLNLLPLTFDLIPIHRSPRGCYVART